MTSLGISNWVTRVGLLVVALAMSTSTALIADECGHRCCQEHRECCECCWNGQVFLVADAIYFRPHRKGFDYATPTDAAGPFDDKPNGEMRDVIPDYDLGYRVFGGYRWCGNWDIAFQYLYYDETRNDTFDPGADQVIPTRGLSAVVIQNYDSAIAQGRVNIDDFQLQGGKTWCCGCHGQIRGFIGVRYTHIEQDFTVTYDAAVGPESQQIDSLLDMWAAGPMMGVEGDTSVYCNYGAFGKATVSMLYANQENKELQFDNGVQVTNQLYCIETVMPVFEMALGVQYTCGGLQAKVGYETQLWIAAASQTREHKAGAAVAEGRFFPIEYDLGFSGPFVRLDIGF